MQKQVGKTWRTSRQRTGPPLRVDPVEAESREIVQIEKSLSTLGFFAVNSGIPADGVWERTVEVVRRTDEGSEKAIATIIATRKGGGFPGIEEQDVYYAILAAVTECLTAGLPVPQPLTFAPGDLLRRMGKKPGGPNFKALARSLRCLALTSIVTDKAIYRASSRQWSSSVGDTYSILDRVRTKGERREDGTVVTQHELWLSAWQLENILDNHRLLIDHASYRRLTKSISKALFPYLQLWLFASRRDARCIRLYEPLTTMIGIKRETTPSRIHNQIGPALDEFVGIGYLDDWELVVATTSFDKTYKLVFHHGPVYRRPDDAQYQADVPNRETLVVPPELVAEDQRHIFQLLCELNVWPSRARKIACDAMRDPARAIQIIDMVRRKARAGEVKDTASYVVYLLSNAWKAAASARDGLSSHEPPVPPKPRRSTGESTGEADGSDTLADDGNDEALFEALVRELSPGDRSRLNKEAETIVIEMTPNYFGLSPEVRNALRGSAFKGLILGTRKPRDRDPG